MDPKDIRTLKEEQKSTSEHRPLSGDEAIVLKERIDELQRLWVECKIKEREYDTMLAHLARGTGAREVALAKTALQESRLWLGEALDVLQSAYLHQTIVI